MRFHDLAALQRNHKLWLEHNFPGQTPHQALLGLAEEVGELAHAHLKYEQGIRGIDKMEYGKQALDAIGDIVMYLASYCNSNDLDLESAVMIAWEEISARDWIANPDTGRPPFTGSDRIGTGQPPSDSNPQRDTGDTGKVGSP